MPAQTTNQNTPQGFDPKYLDPANNPYLSNVTLPVSSGDEMTVGNVAAQMPAYDPTLQPPQVVPLDTQIPVSPITNQVVVPETVLPTPDNASIDATNNPFLQGQMAPINNDQIVFDQNTPAQTLPPLQMGAEPNQPKLDPGILASSFQQFPKEDRPVLISTGANPEVSANRPLEAATENAQEKILEELRNIESSPEATNEQKAPEKPKEEDNKIDESKDHQAKTTGAIGNITVYGYKIPQKVINLGDKLIAMKGIGDVNSAKTWLYALVGRVIEMKTTKEVKDKD